MAGETDAVGELLDRLERSAASQRRVSVGDTVEALGGRGYGPFLFLPALIEMSPIGGIPGVPTFLALIITIFAVQIALGRDHMWLPGFIERRSVDGDRMKAAVDKIRPVGAWLDRWFHGRLEKLTGPGARRIAAVICVILSLSVPPLELLPFASTAPMAAIALFGLAMTLRDGLVMVIAFAASVAAVGVGGWLWVGQ